MKDNFMNLPIEEKEKKIEPTPKPVVEEVKGEVVNTEYLNIRAEATVKSGILITIAKGDKVVIDGEDGEFYAVVTENGIVGYTMKQYIKKI